jgi:hypothetical protein
MRILRRDSLAINSRAQAWTEGREGLGCWGRGDEGLDIFDGGEGFRFGVGGEVDLGGVVLREAEDALFT